MDEKTLIQFTKEIDMDENLDVSYCNKLTSELLQIVKLQHKGNSFKGKQYSDKQKLHVNMAKYYVKAFQLYYAIQKIKNLADMVDLSDIDLPNEVEVLSEEHIAYSCIVYSQRLRDSSKLLDEILTKVMDANTFLPSLEEMDELVAETKKMIQIIQPKIIIKTFDLFVEKRKFNKIFSNL